MGLACSNLKRKFRAGLAFSGMNSSTFRIGFLSTSTTIFFTLPSAEASNDTGTFMASSANKGTVTLMRESNTVFASASKNWPFMSGHCMEPSGSPPVKSPLTAPSSAGAARTGLAKKLLTSKKPLKKTPSGVILLIDCFVTLNIMITCLLHFVICQNASNRHACIRKCSI